MSQDQNKEIAVNSRFLEVYKVLKGLDYVKNKTDFAKSLDMPREYMSLIEQNRRAVPEHHIFNLMNRYNVSHEWLDKGEGTMFTSEPKKPKGSGEKTRNINTSTASGNTMYGGGVVGGAESMLIQEYKGIIEDLKEDKRELKEEIRDLREDKRHLKDEIADLKQRIRELEG